MRVTRYAVVGMLIVFCGCQRNPKLGRVDVDLYIHPESASSDDILLRRRSVAVSKPTSKPGCAFTCASWAAQVVLTGNVAKEPPKARLGYRSRDAGPDQPGRRSEGRQRTPEESHHCGEPMKPYQFWYSFATTGSDGFLLDLIRLPEEAVARLAVFRAGQPPRIVRRGFDVSEIRGVPGELGVQLNKVAFDAGGCRSAVPGIDIEASFALSGQGMSFVPCLLAGGSIACRTSVPATAGFFVRLYATACGIATCLSFARRTRSMTSRGRRGC